MKPCPRLRLVDWVMLLALLAAAGMTSGCTAALATAMYLVQGTDALPDFDGLSEKRVAVVCRPVASLEIRSQNAGHRIAQKLSALLRQRVPHIDVVDPDDIAEWVDNNVWDEYTEIGRALDADLVVGLDLERFGIYEGQTIYQGKANVAVKVQDCKTGEILYEKHIPQIVYPPNRVVSASDQQEPEFRREFVGIVADQVGRLFYRHDRYDDFALDAASMR